MAFGFKKQEAKKAPLVVMAVEMSDGDKIETFKYIVPRLKRSHIVAAQYEARRSMKGVKGAQIQTVANAELIGVLLEGVQPIEGAPAIETLLDYLGDDNIEPFMAELFRLATEDFDTLRAEGVEVQ